MNKIISTKRREAYVEILEILKHMDSNYVEKIPLKLRSFLQKEASKEYEFNIDLSKPLYEHNLNEHTINILAMFNLNYWCEDKLHKEELLNKYYQNSKKHQEELQEKFNTDNIFKNKKKIEIQNEFSENEQTENVALIEVKRPRWYKEFFIKIVNFFKGHKK